MTPDPDVSLLDEALTLARAGWRVFPCETDDKRPHRGLPHGHLDASTDEQTVKRWWRVWPDALIGAPIPPALLVLDVDPRNGGSLAELESNIGPLPPTLTVWSGRGDGGRHLYYARPAQPISRHRIPPGVDLKTSGYMVMPPSRHPATGQAYRWENVEMGAVPLPPFARQALEVPPLRTREHGGGLNSADALLHLVEQAENGNRNAMLYWAACRAVDEGADLEDALVDAAVRCGLSEPEARRTVASAARRSGRA